MEGARYRSLSAVASPVRKSPVPACEARLTAQPYCGRVLISASGARWADVGSRSVLLSRMNVFEVTSGASSGGMSTRGPEYVSKEIASGHASTRSEASAAWTLCDTGTQAGEHTASYVTFLLKMGKDESEERTPFSPSRSQSAPLRLRSPAGRQYQRREQGAHRYPARSPRYHASCLAHG
jgi:hypothetical protein